MQTQNPAAPQVDGVEWGVRRHINVFGSDSKCVQRNEKVFGAPG